MIVRALLIATTLGALLQVTMVLVGHHNPVVKDYFGPGGMILSLAAGVVYARMASSGWGDILVGGAISGGVCALIGIGICVSLRDAPVSLLAVGTIGSAIAGLVGSAIGKALS